MVVAYMQYHSYFSESMVRKYVRKTDRGAYGEAALGAALVAIQQGQPVKTVARQYNIPPKTLRRHRDGYVRAPGAVQLGRNVPVLPLQFEEQLVRYIQIMESQMYALTTTDVRRLAYELAERQNLQHPFDRNTRMAGKDWLRSFMARHPTLSIRVPIGTSLARINGFNQAAVDGFFQNYQQILTGGNFDVTNIWNCDETGFSNVVEPGKVIATKGVRQIRSATSGERGKNVTALCCMSAAGNFIPPLFIFPRKRMVAALMNGAPAGSISGVNERGSGYIDGNLFVRWLQHFVAVTNCSRAQPHLLILDGHESHKTLQAIDFARDNGLTLISLPPHASHRMQPLDRTFFKSLKSSYSKAVNNWMLSNRGRRLTQFDIIPLFATAYNRSATVDSATKGFRITGIWPFDDAVFDAELQAPLQANLPGGQGPANPPAAQGPAMPPAAQGPAIPAAAQVPGQANPPAIHGPANAPVAQGPANPPAAPGPAQANPPAAPRPDQANPLAAPGPVQANPPAVPEPTRANPPAAQRPAQANPPAAQRPDRANPAAAPGPVQANPPAVPGPTRANPPSTQRPARANPPASKRPARASPAAVQRPAQANPPAIRDTVNPPFIQEPANPPASQGPANPPPVQEPAKPPADKQPVKRSAAQRPAHLNPLAAKRPAKPLTAQGLARADPPATKGPAKPLVTPGPAHAHRPAAKGPAKLSAARGSARAHPPAAKGPSRPPAIQEPAPVNPPSTKGPANPPAIQESAHPAATKGPVQAKPPTAQGPARANPPAAKGPANPPSTQGPAEAHIVVGQDPLVINEITVPDVAANTTIDIDEIFLSMSPTGPKKGKSPVKRKTRVQRSAVLTSSPYKAAITEKVQKGKGGREPKPGTSGSGESRKKGQQKRPAKRATKQPQPKRRKRNRKRSEAAETDEDEEWPCIVCGEPFGNSRPGEEWVMCISCRRWAHEECTPMQHVAYVCHNCESDDDLWFHTAPLLFT